MKREPPYVVLIGDIHEARIEQFRGVIQDDFRSKLIVTNNAKDFADVLENRRDLDAVIVHSNMPGHLVTRLRERVQWIKEFDNFYGDILAVFDGPYSYAPKQRRVHALDWATVAGRGDVKRALARFLDDPPGPPGVDLCEPSDLLLDRQVRGLCPEGRLAGGMAHLASMIRDLDFPCRSARVGRLGQGYSGALVLKVEAEHDGKESHYVFKIVKDIDRWKLRREIEHWPVATSTLDPTNMTPRAPELILPKLGALKEQGLVGSGNSCAICYRFLGEPAGKFCDLEAIYLGLDPDVGAASGPTDRPTPADPADRLISDLLDMLRDAWHSRVQIDSRPLWLAEDAEHRQMRVFPPYQLTAWEKAFALGSLEKLARPGRRLLGEQEWVMSADKIQRWLRGDHPLYNRLGRQQPATISHVHGDLNANNILIWKAQQRPFLIDFACFQPNGHVMQDFARLEAEIKFALMDREEAVEDPAFDHSSHRLPIWCLMERDLASAHWAKATMPLGGRERFVARALRLIQGIRRRARETWALNPGGGDSEKNGFLTEYGASLLHYTLRAIGYETLSPFKRLLAVFSAARWIDLLDSGLRDPESS
jgi:hypothetical protein